MTDILYTSIDASTVRVTLDLQASELTTRSRAALFLSVLPTPLALLTDEAGEQHVHIAPEAFKVVNAAFNDEIDVWQNALPDHLKGQLESVSVYTSSSPSCRHTNSHW